MKRCMICGNMDEDNSTVCSMCGNPYVDMSEGAAGAGEANAEETADAAEPENTAGQEEPKPQETEPEGAAGQPEAQEMSAEEPAGADAAEQPEAQEMSAEGQVEADAAEQPEAQETSAAEQAEADAEAESESAAEQPETDAAPKQPTAGSRPVRRMRGGPQIYGQDELMNSNPELFANQGAIRRDVPPRSAGPMQGGMSRPMNQAPAGGAGRPVNRMPAGMGRPMGQMPAGAARPSGQDFLSRRVMEIARKALKSPLFFLIVLLNTARVASSIAAIFLGELNYSQVVRLLNETELPKQMSGFVNMITHFLQQLDSGMILQNIALHIPSILFCLGLWLIFITALAAKDRMSGVGFGFAKVAVIIRMIVAGVVMLGTLIFTVTLVIAAWVSKDTQVIIVTAIVLVIAIVITMIVIMYYFSYLATLKTCRVNADAGESYGKPSRYLAVLHIILALPSIVGILSGIVNMEISNIVGSSAELLWMILFAVWIFLYRGRMSELEE